MARRVVYSRPESTPESLQAACWHAAGNLAASNEVDRIDGCLSAAATALSPDLNYRHERAFLVKPSSAGVGIVIKAQPDQSVLVVDVIPVSPAAISGVRVGERVLAVDGQPVMGSSLDEVTALIRGASDSTVSLTLQDLAGKERSVSLKRSAITTKPAYAQNLQGALYLQVRNIPVSESRSAVVLNHLQMLIRQRMGRQPEPEVVVLDLRGNKGGLAEALLNISTLFVQDPESTMPVLDEDGLRRMGAGSMADTRVHTWLKTRSLMVLIDNDTSSGTEWLIETLRRQAGAVIVGDTTPGAIGIKRAHFIDEDKRIEWPTGLMLSEGGGLAKGRGVQPDMKLSAEQLADNRIGMAPRWLEGWLQTDWPKAQEAAAQRLLTRPASWPLTPAPQGFRAMCAGGVQAHFPAGDVSGFSLVEGHIRKAERWSLAVHRLADSELSALLKPLLGPPIGPMGAHVYAEAGSHMASWVQGDLRYELTAELPTSRALLQPKRLLNHYTRLLSEFRMLPTNTVPIEPALCLGQIWTPLSTADKDFDWMTTWEIMGGEHGVWWNLEGRYLGNMSLNDLNLSPSATRGADRTDGALDLAHSCHSRQIPAISTIIENGLEWLVSSRLGVQEGKLCEAQAAALLSPHYPSAGWSLKASHLHVASPTSATNESKFIDSWSAMLRSVRVAPLGLTNDHSRK